MSIRTGMRTGRSVPARRFQVRPWMVLVLLFVAGAGLGLVVRACPSPTEIRLEWTLATLGGPGSRVSVVDLPGEGRLAVGVGVPGNSRLSPAAAEAVVKSELRLGPADTIAVATLPDRPPAAPILEIAGLVVLLAGLALTVWRLVPGLLRLWKAWRTPRPAPEPELERTERCVVTWNGWALRSVRRSVAEWRRTKVRDLGVPVCPIAVVSGPSPGLRIDGQNWGAPRGELLTSLDAHLLHLIGIEQVSQLLEFWRATHPGLIGELSRRVKLERLLSLVRSWLQSGQDLKSFDIWAEHLLMGLEEHSQADLLGAVAISLQGVGKC